MIRLGIALLAASVLLPADGVRAALPSSANYSTALTAWRDQRFDQAYSGFLQVRSSHTAGALSLDTAYYLLTAGCHHSRVDIAKDSKARLQTLATDKRGESEDGQKWRDAFVREVTRCGNLTAPGLPPSDILLGAGVRRRPGLPPPGANGIFKSHSGDPLESGMPSQATSPVRDPSASLPAALLDLRRDNPDAARKMLVASLGNRVLVGNRVVLIRVSDKPEAYNLTAVMPQVDRFTQQLETDLGLPSPEGYFFVVIYPDPNTPPPYAVPRFPVNDRVLGFADTRTGTAYVIANGTLKGAVFHEIAHLYVDAALGPEAPEWLSEGLASLYEQTRVVGDHIVGDRSYRGAWLQCRPRLVPSVETLINRGWYLDGELMGEVTDYPGVVSAIADRAGVNNAAERYFARYLQEEGLLPRTIRYYATLRDTPTGAWPLDSRAGRNDTLEAATGRSIVALNAGFAAWWPKDVQAGTGSLPDSVGAAFRAPAGCEGLFDPYYVKTAPARRISPRAAAVRPTAPRRSTVSNPRPSSGRVRPNGL